ncbi:MAG: arginase family protein, partial [Nitrososphaerales archaeon]
MDKLTADIGILGAPSDEGSPMYPGQRYAPRRIREMSLRYAGVGPSEHEGYFDVSDGQQYLTSGTGARIVDCGDVDILYSRPDLTLDNITAAVTKLIRRGVLPVVFGGDHGVSYGVV